MSDLELRRQEEKDRRREQILDAALAIAEQVGVEGFTMDQVAKKARLSRALIYVYFRDKEELVFGLAERAHAELVSRFSARLAEGENGIETTLLIGQSYADYAIGHPVYFDTQACFVTHLTDVEDQTHSEQQCTEAAGKILELLVQALRRGVNDGSIRADLGSLHQTAMTLWGLMYGTVQLILAKEALLSHLGTTQRDMVQNALTLARRAIERPGIAKAPIAHGIPVSGVRGHE